MTTITKPVIRQTQQTYNVLRVSEDRHIVCSMLPGDVLEFREKGKRGRWTVAIVDAFRAAVRTKAQAEVNAKKTTRYFKAKRSKL